MTLGSLLLIGFSECCAIAGQIFFKMAMGHHWEKSRTNAWLLLAAGVAAMALGFFVWLRLLATFDLSFLYPFEGISRLILLAAAALFLKEKVRPSLWLGVLLISAGVVLVAAS